MDEEFAKLSLQISLVCAKDGRAEEMKFVWDAFIRLKESFDEYKRKIIECASH